MLQRKLPAQITRFTAVSLLLILGACWLSVVLALVIRRMPYIDDGLYTLAPHSRMTRGDWGSPEIEPSRFILPGEEQPLTRIDRRTYWIMPLTTHLETAWFRVFGWGLIQQRLISVTMGLFGAVIWFDLVRRLSKDALLAGLAALTISFSWAYITASTAGRMEMLGHTLGLLAFYWHERFFASRPLLARFLSGMFLSATAMVHPNAFAAWCAVYGVRSAIQWRQFRLAQIAALLAPVLITAGLFALWISYDFQAFREQIIAQSSFRWSPSRPSEVRRYLEMFGLLPNPFVGNNLKAIPLVTTLLALLIGVLILFVKWRDSLRLSGLREVVCFGLAASLGLALFDKTKWGLYGIYVVPWLFIIAAYGLRSIRNGAGRALAVAWLTAYVLVAAFSAVYVARRNSIETVYLPAVAALRSLGVRNSMVFAPPEFRFAYDGPFLFDIRLGYVTGREVPAIAVRRESLQDSVDWAQNHDPVFTDYMERLLQNACSQSFQNEMYLVYSCGGQVAGR